MEQNTQIWQFEPETEGENQAFQPEAQEYLDEAYGEEYNDYQVEGEEFDAAPYDVLDDDLEEMERAGGRRRFRVAMNVFDSASVLAGVIAILALTALIVSMVSWLRTDILHSFVLLQSGIQ